MTPAEHYCEAERLLTPGEYDDPDSFWPSPSTVALAQVHATLATADGDAVPNDDASADSW